MNECECNDIYPTIDLPLEKVASKIFAIKNFVCNEFIYGGHLLAIGAATVVLATMILLNTTMRWELLPLAYLLLLCVYNYDHYQEIDTDSSDNSNRTNHIKKYHGHLPLIITIYGVAYFSLLLFFGNIESIILGVILLILGVAYTGGIKKLTRKILGFKNIYTSFSLSLLIIFTALFCSYLINLLVIIFFVFLFLRFLVNTSFCDIKDMNTDKKQKLLTLPLFFGKNRFLIFLHVLNILSFLIIGVAIVMQVIPWFTLILFIFYLYCFYYLQRARNPKVNIQSLSGIIVDGEFLFWPVFLFLGKTIMTII